MKKEDILEANLDSKEMEVIVLPGKPFDISKEKLIGAGFTTAHRRNFSYYRNSWTQHTAAKLLDSGV